METTYSLADALENPKQTQDLYVSHTEWLEAGSKVIKLSELRKLTLHGNGWRDLKKGNVGGGLTQLPDTIAKLPKLEILELYGNSFTSFPKELLAFSQLRELDLADNRMVELIDGLEVLKKLHTLSLGENPFKKLGRELLRIGRLPALKALIYRGLPAIPPELFTLTSLRNLNIYQGKFTELPAGIGALVNLETLSVDKTRLTRLPKEIGKLVKLKELGLSKTLLTELPAEIGKLTQLESLKVERAELTSVPKELGQCVNLKVLDLAANALTSLPDSLENLKKLEKLLLYENQLADIPAGLKNRKKLKLNMEDNKPPVDKAGLSKLLAKISRNCLGGEPVPTDLAVFWKGQLSNDSLIGETDYGEVTLVSELGADFFEMFEGSPPPEQPVLDQIAFFAREADGALIGYWRFKPGMKSSAAPILMIDNEGQFSVVATNLADYLLVRADDSGDEEAVQTAREWLKAHGLKPTKSPSAIRAEAKKFPDPNKRAEAARSRPEPRAARSRAATGPRRFEFSEGGSQKFWEIAVRQKEHTVRFGRIGTDGQAKTKSFADAAAAAKEAEKLVQEKLRKGYVEQ